MPGHCGSGVGSHTGAAIKERGDFFGRTVIVAARVADAARGREVLVTDEVRAALFTNFRFGPPAKSRSKASPAPTASTSCRGRGRVRCQPGVRDGCARPPSVSDFTTYVDGGEPGPHWDQRARGFVSP